MANDTEKNYHLTCDINLNNNVWTPIPAYSGIFNGNGFTVKNFVLSTNESWADYGFFCINNGTIKNLSFADFTFNTNYTREGHTNIAVLAGTNNGLIEQCEIKSGVIQCNYTSIDSTSGGSNNYTFRLGAVVGYNCGRLVNASNFVAMSVFVLGNSTHHHSWGGNSYKIAYFDIGGLVGENVNLVVNSYSVGNLNIESSTKHIDPTGYQNNYVYCGALIGRQSGNGICRNSYGNAHIEYKTKNISGSGNDFCRIGGLVGGVKDGSSLIESCYSLGTISGGSRNDNIIGGLVGHNENNAQILSCYTSVNIVSGSGGSLGGLIGKNDAVIQNSYASGDIVADANANVGGFAGTNASAGSIFKCYSTGDVTSAGGSVGYFVGSSAGVISKCYFMQGATKLVAGQYITSIEYNTIESKLCGTLWNEDFLVGELYWNEGGWIIASDDNPLLQWELESGHNFQTRIVEPTCEYIGFTIYSCIDCSRVFALNFTEATGHNWEKTLEVPASCTAGGYTTYKCTVCNNEKNEATGGATGHPDDCLEEQSRKEATCTEDGYAVYRCNKCNAFHRVTLNATGHSDEFVEFITEPTCTAEGEASYFCSKCGQLHNETVPKIDHTRVDVEYKEPSCSYTYDDDGEINGSADIIGNMPGVKCSVCGEVLYGCEPIDPHTWEFVEVITTADCTKAGLQRVKCSNCGKEDEQDIKALGHTDANRDNICDVCRNIFFDITTVSQNAFIHIKDIAGLKAISSNPSAYYWLDNDIDLSGVDWTPIGTSIMPFKGILYGNGHTVRNLNVALNGDDGAVIGLFGYNSGIIIDLIVSDFNVVITNADCKFGGIVAYNNGSVINCSLSGANNISADISLVVDDTQEHTLSREVIIGGLVGVNRNIVDACNIGGSIVININNTCRVLPPHGSLLNILEQLMRYTKATTVLNFTFGGVIGINERTVNNCTVSADISSVIASKAEFLIRAGELTARTHFYAGALVGFNSGEITDCSAKAMMHRLEDRSLAFNIFNRGLIWQYVDRGRKYGETQEVLVYSTLENGISGIVGSNDGTISNLTVG